MDIVHIYPFSLRMARFTQLGRDSYVGARVFPRLALLYAASLIYTNGPYYEFVHDYIQEYIDDVYFELYSDRPEQNLSLNVPRATSARAFIEILQGAELLTDIARDLGVDVIEEVHHYRAVVDILRDTFIVVRKDAHGK